VRLGGIVRLNEQLRQTRRLRACVCTRMIGLDYFSDVSIQME
jgi:hypothetical protein